MIYIAEKLFVLASMRVGGFKSNYIYKIFNGRKNIRGSLLAFGLDSPSLLGFLAAVMHPAASSLLHPSIPPPFSALQPSTSHDSRASWLLRPLTCRDRGFESHRGHGCLSVVSVVCCQVEVSATC